MSKTTKVSVIVPVYNEAKTVGKVLDDLLAIKLKDIQFEIIVVYSWSQDGTLEVLEPYRLRRGITVTQTKAMGKGAAVRRGLYSATGNIIMIQDADSEYSIGDYPSLLDPIIEGRAEFVLGVRHGHGNGVRQFTGQPALQLFMNIGHQFFTFLINRMFGAKLKDPFTMFKVFRARCISGMEFKCRRFDFDFELLIKLLQRGYVPFEVPVSYVSRSFKDGKKIRLLRDPLTWLWTLARLWLRRNKRS